MFKPKPQIQIFTFCSLEVYLKDTIFHNMDPDMSKGQNLVICWWSSPNIIYIYIRIKFPISYIPSFDHGTYG
jgi:hypothetical protein